MHGTEPNITNIFRGANTRMILLDLEIYIAHNNSLFKIRKTRDIFVILYEAAEK